MNALTDALSQLGAECVSTKGDGYAPLIIKGPINAGEVQVDGTDSQPVSALLIASIFLNGETSIHVNNAGEKPWVSLTLDWLDRLNVDYTRESFDRYIIRGGVIKGFDYTVSGDFSTIAYPLIAALVTQSEITIENIDMHDPQGDKQLIEILQSMGANFNY